MRRPRLVIRRLLLVSRPPKAQNTLRAFTQNSASLSNPRPQLPFLSVPTTTRQQFRYLTTERKRWLRYELLLSVKYTLYFWAIVGCVVAAGLAVQQEWAERDYPTPHEWSLMTRIRLRGARSELDREDRPVPNWVDIISMLQDALRRLEDPAIDGAGVADAPRDRPPGTKDISGKSEPWRRGYYEVMMAYAKAAEHLDGWVVDKTRGIVFPPDVVVGPSNPRPSPIPPGAKSAPREEDCEVAYPSPDEIYLRILSTEGLTTRQRMDAALAYANYLEFKDLLGPAVIILEDAVYLAESDRPASAPEQLDRKTWTLNEATRQPSENLLKSLTAYATFKARHGDVSSALPIFVSILRARRSLPSPTAQPAAIQDPRDERKGVFHKISGTISRLVQPPVYPPPPEDGTSPPIRDVKELCEEAALHLHIGEIMYTAQSASREEGLAWTREAVDIAEEQLHKLGTATTDKQAQGTCRECLASGLDNWTRMVTKLAREEETKRAAGQPTFSWLGLWGEGKSEQPGRWAAEEQVVQERTRRARDILEDVEPPAKGPSSFFWA